MKFIFIVLINLCSTLFSVKIYSDEACISRIPKKIWQTYKTKNLPRPAKKAQSSWIKQNSNYAYNLWDDNDIAAYILNKWDNETYRFFKALPLGVMKADLWRYLILTTEGGIYSDIDSLCLRPINEWTSEIIGLSQDVLLIGLEECQPSDFCQWTIAATPHHPALEYVCKYLITNWKQNGINRTIPNFVHLTTGPSIWTKALISYLGESPTKTAVEIYNRYINDLQFKQNINNLGIFIFSDKFYQGFASINLYGSMNFGEGYIRWPEEKNSLKKQIKPLKKLPVN